MLPSHNAWSDRLCKHLTKAVTSIISHFVNWRSQASVFSAKPQTVCSCAAWNAFCLRSVLHRMHRPLQLDNTQAWRGLTLFVISPFIVNGTQWHNLIVRLMSEVMSWTSLPNLFFSVTAFWSFRFALLSTQTMHDINSYVKSHCQGISL